MAFALKYAGLFAVVVSLGLSSVLQAADGYPGKPIRMIVGFPP